MTQFFDNPGALFSVDWDVIENKYWANRDDDLDRKRRKQAEFLVQGFFPWSWVERIGVIDVERKTRVEELLAGASCRPAVCVERDWYY